VTSRPPADHSPPSSPRKMRCPHFLQSEYANADAVRAAFHVIPVPMETSVSYGRGTARGPAAILAASRQLEADDRGVAPGRLGIHTQPVARPAGGRDTAEAWLTTVAARVAKALQAGARPLLLGGEHTLTLGAARAFRAAGRRVGFVQFDAHADLRDSYEGTPLSHACVMRRIAEMGFPLLQLATRACCEEERLFRRRRRIVSIDPDILAGPRAPSRLFPRGFPAEVYVTFDVDALDPSQMPATGTPVAGGLSWREAVVWLDRVAAARRIVGADVVELAPIPRLHHADFTAAQLAHRLLALMMPAP
jgi:agmatinase